MMVRNMLPRRHRIATLLWAAILAFAPAGTSQSPGGRALQRTTLDNGLQVLVIENHAVPLATILIAVRNGAFTQRPGEEGLAHLYEHIVFRAYGGDPSRFDLEVARLNGAANGTTGEEVVTYFVMVPSEKAEHAIRLLARLIPGARFGHRDLQEERPVVLDEIERAESDPERELERRAARQLWGDAWHRKDVGGDSASLQAITLDRLKATYARYYVPNNAALIVTGDVSTPDMFDAARQHFGKWKRGPDPFADRYPPPIQPLSGNRAVIMGKDVLDVTILVQLHGASLRADTASTYAADLLFEILNEPSSAFQRRLVESGLFQSLAGTYRTSNDVGPITISGKTTPERAEDALLALAAELDQLDWLADVTTDDLAIARQRRRVEMALAREGAAGSAPHVALWWASAGIDYYLTYEERMNAQTLDDIRRFAERYAVGKPKVIAVLGPPATTARIAEWLQGKVTARP